MSHRIKLRAWDAERRCFCYSTQSGVDFVFGKMGDGVYIDNLMRLDLTDENTSQFTGLKDRNGREIYKGDILRHPYMTDEDDPAEPDVGYLGSESVKYAIGEVKISPYLGPYLKLRSGSIRRVTRHRVVGGEVIGNVYEHGHLMEVNS